ncbi:undecaprenyl-diphosphatase UppP [Enterobacteriaceae endosymbiont of Donacia piscatrix]|uniref:undecaprenyl-diphosphatase UppP n=1 Tax=Enterobacteriaceae endosymbiont of Donacia piscatrix TaxID=2675780 RepID=UPI001448CFE8|nr:undecaprenyl-diphosphatase UppP [Enterobacteriaceae endosymbiont of Donacia piscatrix]QJC34908.1 undecaprenyl-diphosphatase UppP [Enterobacteriaceae endosymbiont of Donacia piscatrix]
MIFYRKILIFEVIMITLNYFSIIILSIIQSLTEFLPISSSAHVIIFSKILNIINNKNLQIFEITIQLGSTFAIIIIFWKKIIQIILNTIYHKIYDKKKINIFKIIISTLPVIFIGLIFSDKIIAINNILYIIYGLFLGGLLLLFSEIYKPKIHNIKNLNYISYNLNFIIGCFQCLALLPGVSRLGSTLSISLLLGIKRSIAIDFCFILSIPVIFGANLLTLYNNYSIINFNDYKILFIGFFISFIISLFLIKKFIYLINNISLIWFSIYRIFLILILILIY